MFFRSKLLLPRCRHFDREMADLTAAGPPQLPQVMALADRYGLQLAQPDWLPELIARYHVTPPPGGGA
jgi:hypothetical protein